MSTAGWLDRVELHDRQHVGEDRGLTVLDLAQCGTCGRVWCETCHPTPAARCPFEYEHEDTEPMRLNDDGPDFDGDETERPTVQEEAERLLGYWEMHGDDPEAVRKWAVSDLLGFLRLVLDDLP